MIPRKASCLLHREGRENSHDLKFMVFVTILMHV